MKLLAVLLLVLSPALWAGGSFHLKGKFIEVKDSLYVVKTKTKKLFLKPEGLEPKHKDQLIKASASKSGAVDIAGFPFKNIAKSL